MIETAQASRTTFTYHRALSGNREPDGPIAVLIVVCILFCFIWTPLICQRQCRRRRRSRRRQQQQAEELIRVSLQNLNLLAHWEAAGFPGLTSGGRPRLSSEDRRDFIKNMLVSKKISKITFAEKPSPEVDGDEKIALEDVDLEAAAAANNTETPSSPQNTKTEMTMLLVDVLPNTQQEEGQQQETTTYVTTETCAICLTDYVQGEILCWSQSDRCNHVFHRDCMEEWLLKHNECPCCRHNYLGLKEDDDDDGIANQDVEINGDALAQGQQQQQENNNNNNHTSADRSAAVLRGMHLFYLLSRLHNLAAVHDDEDETNNNSSPPRIDGSGLELPATTAATATTLQEEDAAASSLPHSNGEEEMSEFPQRQQE